MMMPMPMMIITVGLGVGVYQGVVTWVVVPQLLT